MVSYKRKFRYSQEFNRCLPLSPSSKYLRKKLGYNRVRIDYFWLVFHHYKPLNTKNNFEQNSFNNDKKKPFSCTKL